MTPTQICKQVQEALESLSELQVLQNWFMKAPPGKGAELVSRKHELEQRIHLALALMPALIQAVGEMEWHDIETRPTRDEDGSFIVLCPGNDACASMELQVSVFEGRMYPDHMNNLIDWGNAITDATHWRPKTLLPKPPAESEPV
ncbi:MAG: hypothetical protein P4L85_14220 [Paludisphaera borealis]|uniref:hypothetical protein n=1 Tax=Paludisphaera borealis TaxID=1387353 RepID=UPI0028445DB4|nr:hypothetical protein [Paludisphaera borealis]MDR3620502.1 hypothetical protein [Paludisphaera borealis]